VSLRVTYVSRRAWPSVGGISNNLRLLCDALPPLERVQILTPRTDQGWPQQTDVLAAAAFASFARGQTSTEPLRVRGGERLPLLPALLQPRLAWLPRGAGWLWRRAFAGYAAGVGAAIARCADRPDLLHVMGGGSLAAAGVVAARRLDVPLIVAPSAHPGQWDDEPQSGAAYRRADLVVAQNDADATTYRRLGVADSRLRVLEPCTAVLGAGGGEELRRRERIDGPLVLFVGARQAYKGLDLLLDAASELSRRIGDLTLAVVGHGPPVAAPAGVRVIDAGAVSDEAKAAWLEAADVLALPSSNEAFGLVIAEAWSVGTPVVTSDIPVLASLVRASGGGIAAPREPGALADALEELLRAPDRARELGAAGRRYWSERLSPAAAAARTLRAYDDLLG
jgi:glycosyltransferase involved in cell wall biosynthesis